MKYRPAFHSVNIVRILNEYYWVDSANNAFDRILLDIEDRNGFQIAYIRSKNTRIPYKLAPIFQPRDVIVNIFGNLQALKTRKAEDSITIDF